LTSKLEVLEQEKTNMRTLLNEAGVEFLAKQEEVAELTKIVKALKVRSLLCRVIFISATHESINISRTR
jgi:hypothetical protein